MPIRALLLLFHLFPPAVFALGWEQAGYVTLSQQSKVAYLKFAPTPEQESHGLMVYSSKTSRNHFFCAPHFPNWDSERELRCAPSEKGLHERIYKAVPENNKHMKEARRIFSLYQRGKKRCDAGDFSGYLYCVHGCDADPTKLLVEVHYTECVDEPADR